MQLYPYRTKIKRIVADLVNKKIQHRENTAVCHKNKADAQAAPGKFNRICHFPAIFLLTLRNESSTKPQSPAKSYLCVESCSPQTINHKNVMPDEINITPKSESAPTAGHENPTASSGRTQLVNLCALGLGVSFFLPWAHFFFATPSGFDLQKAGDEQRLLWIIPIFCAITIFAGITKRSQKIIGQLTGALPFVVGAYWYYKLGSDLPHILMYGAYLSLIFGAALFVLPRNAK